MNKNIVLSALFSIGASFSLNAVASPSFEIGGSTLGAGLTVGQKITDYFAIRGQVNGMSFNHQLVNDSISYNGKLKLLSGGLLADWHPFHGSFRITAGGYYNANKFSASGSSTTGGNLTVGDKEYSLQSLDVGVKFKTFAPYAGIGWSAGFNDSGVILSLDLGALYQGSPLVSASATANPGTQLPNDFNASLERERKKLEDKLSRFNIYPVASLSIGYRF